MSKQTIKSYILAGLLLLCVATVAAAQSNDAERLYANAVRLHQAGDIENAIREYKAFLVLYPNVIEARSNLGAAYARLGRYEEAIEQYRQALTLKPGNPQIHFNLALAYYKAALYSEAAAEFTKIRAADPSNKNALLLLADCHLQMGETNKVIELLAPLATDTSADLTVAYILGTAYIQEKQTEKGQVLIDRILRNGESAEARLMMGSAQLMIHDYPGAVKEFERAIALNPKLPTAHSLYGQALLSSGNRDAAMKSLQAELEINPNDFRANLYIGMLLNEDQKYAEALKYMEKALSVRPRELNVSYYIATIYTALGKTVEAQRLLEEIVKQAPDFVEAHVKLATVYYRLKRKEDGDRERAIILKLNAERQEKAPGAKDGLGPAYRGEQPDAPVKKPDAPPQQ
ncbi:MAG: tetratricopeptide repeat protein [Blastocatellia bacterium]